MYDKESSWPKQLLIGVGALVVVALLIGGIVGIIAVKATDFAGVGETTTAEPSGLVIPERSPSETEEADPGPAGASDKNGDTAKQPKQPKKSKKVRRPPPITLTASPTQVSPMGRIDLTGTYRGGDGATLQVQRFEGGSWSDFPVDVTVNGSAYATWIQSGREGRNRFRVVDTATGRASNVVRVTIG